MEIIKKIIVCTLVIFLLTIFVRGLLLDSPVNFECKDLSRKYYLL